ncbi:MAG: (Fe-S)-binding protein [Gammaproteobacteria bacterium]|nr:(Fe-S)-binding protein [Gammaproteobacteria bacterium]MCZ6716721.1 (Fe-S)-binding protein [Gammaproteobacteria bacterium]MCZ6826747.1 (Fe-S)-binding protein [Gammaproteobacteria bacterium]MCZ6912887.1 (Fe-S)-binding protein [Pseudomonadota bacterium]
MNKADPSMASRYVSEAADRCVKCGLCLPHCPTYGLEMLESDSPRGRIALMEGLASGELPVSDGMIRHLDGCLGCRACEIACPAEVPYGRLLDTARTVLRQHQVRPRLSWRVFALAVQSRWVVRLGAVLMQLFGRLRRVSGASFKRRDGLSRLLRLIPDQVSISRLAVFHPADAAEEKRGTIELFTGCLGEALEGDTLKATIRVLNGLGFDVRVPASQGCCGAIHQHAGYPQKAAQLAAKNIRAFAGDHIVIVVSTGCLASLCEYDDFFGEKSRREDARQFAARCTDINEFLNIQLRAGAATFGYSGTEEAVALHTPCTRKVIPGNTQAARELLMQQASIDCLTLGNGQCCGAAGAYMLDQPESSQALAERYDIGIAPILLTSNIGCRLQLEALCRQQGITATVAHPVSLLAECDGFSQTATTADIQ